MQHESWPLIIPASDGNWNNKLYLGRERGVFCAQCLDIYHLSRCDTNEGIILSISRNTGKNFEVLQRDTTQKIYTIYTQGHSTSDSKPGTMSSSWGQECLSSTAMSIKYGDDFRGISKPHMGLTMEVAVSCSWQQGHCSCSDSARDPSGQSWLSGLLSDPLNWVKRCSANSLFNGNLIIQSSAKNLFEQEPSQGALPVVHWKGICYGSDIILFWWKPNKDGLA